MILWIAAVPLLLAMLYVVFATPLYTASTQILIDPRDRRIVSNEVTPEALAADGGVAVVESQQLVITSDVVLRRAIAREHLDADPEFGAPSTDCSPSHCATASVLSASTPRQAIAATQSSGAAPIEKAARREALR
jgi:uncharacterized protein involved in exopolysaccharide biosynthesis